MIAVLHRELTDEILPYAIDIAEQRERHELDVHEKLFGKAELAPTRLGNDVAALRSYCETRYGLEFDFFWPRLQLAMKDDKLAAKLSAAQIQVEFSILSLTLSMIFVVFWMIELGGWGDSFTPLLLLAVFGPPVVVIWLWLVHESYSTYAELVRGPLISAASTCCRHCGDRCRRPPRLRLQCGSRRHGCLCSTSTTWTKRSSSRARDG